jgi:hypothetical protein
MRDRIWTELTQAKHSLEFTYLYADRQRKYLRYFNVLILVFSTGGVMGWRIWDNAPALSCLIIATISLIRLLQPQLIMTEKQISNLDTISKFYTLYYNKLERLWFDTEDDSLNQSSAKDEFFKILQTESEVSALINETIRTKPKSLISKAKLHSDQYFKLSFNTYHDEKNTNTTKTDTTVTKI